MLADYLGQLDLDEAAERYRKHVEAIPVRADPRGLLLDRQEDRASDRRVGEEDRRDRRPVRRRRRLRPDPQGQGAAAVVRGAGAVHLVPLGAARGLGQPERVRDGHAQEERQHHDSAAGDRPRTAAVGRPARRADGQPRHGARHQRADRRHRRVVHRLRHRASEGDRRVACRRARARRASTTSPASSSRPSRRLDERRWRRRVAQALYNHLIQNDYIDDDGTGHPGSTRTHAPPGRSPHPPSDALKPVIDFVWPLVDALYLDVPKPTDGRKPKKIPFNEANFEEARVPGAVGAHQPQGRLPSRVRLRRADRQLRPGARQAPQRHRHAIPRRRAGKQVVGLEADAARQPARASRCPRRRSTHSSRVGRLDRSSTTFSARSPRRPSSPAGPAQRSSPASTPATFAKFRQNPEQFITEAARLINEQKATVIVEHLAYDALDDRYDSSIFTENQTPRTFEGRRQAQEAHLRLRRHRLEGRARLRRPSSTPATRSSSTPSCRAASSSRPRLATTTPTGPSPSREGKRQARLLRRRDQGLALDPPTQGSRGGQDRVRPQVLRIPQREARPRCQVRRRHRLHRADATRRRLTHCLAPPPQFWAEITVAPARLRFERRDRRDLRWTEAVDPPRWLTGPDDPLRCRDEVDPEVVYRLGSSSSST